MRKGLIAPSSSLGLSDGTGGEGLVRMGLIAPSCQHQCIQHCKAEEHLSRHQNWKEYDQNQLDVAGLFRRCQLSERDPLT